MSLSHEHVGSKIPAKINTYMLTRAELLIHLCYEIPCNRKIFGLVDQQETPVVDNVTTAVRYLCTKNVSFFIPRHNPNSFQSIHSFIHRICKKGSMYFNAKVGWDRSLLHPSLFLNGLLLLYYWTEKPFLSKTVDNNLNCK